MSVVHAPMPTRGLRWLVGLIDGLLRRVLGVTEFEPAGSGLLRIELGRAERDVTLSDGTRLGPDDAVLELHLWNEQMLPVPMRGADFGWAVRMRRQTLATLRRLARRVRDDPGFAAVRAVRMRPATARRKRIDVFALLLPKIGFEPVAQAGAERGPVLRFLDNVWLWLLTWAHNPQALKGRRFSRRREEFWISRGRFLAIHGEPAAGPDRVGQAEPPGRADVRPPRSAGMGSRGGH